MYMYTNSMFKKVHSLWQAIHYYLLFIAIVSIQRIRIYFSFNSLLFWYAYSSANCFIVGTKNHCIYLQFKCFCIMYSVEKLRSNTSQTSFYQICVYFSLYTYLLSGNKTICKLLFLYKTGLPYHAKNEIFVPSQNITINSIIL